MIDDLIIGQLKMLEKQRHIIFHQMMDDINNKPLMKGYIMKTYIKQVAPIDQKLTELRLKLIHGEQ